MDSKPYSELNDDERIIYYNRIMKELSQVNRQIQEKSFYRKNLRYKLTCNDKLTRLKNLADEYMIKEQERVANLEINKRKQSEKEIKD
jgi:hypothetical protein